MFQLNSIGVLLVISFAVFNSGCKTNNDSNLSDNQLTSATTNSTHEDTAKNRELMMRIEKINIADLTAMTIPDLPDWTSTYRKPGDHRFFNLTALGKKYSLTRYQASEIQNYYRDFTRPLSWPMSDEVKVAAYKKALKKVIVDKTYEALSDPDRIAAAKFIVVFDLDNTLYDQHAPSISSCHDISISRTNGKKSYIKFVPGWDTLINRIDELGGEVVLFTANFDDLSIENCKHWLLNKKPILQSGKVSGLFTNSFLVRRHKNESPKNRPIKENSKDLRLIDPTRKKVIIVDNNPTRIIDIGNTRLVPRFVAKKYCDLPNDAKAAYNSVLPTVQKEIESAISYMNANPGVGFRDAFKPFTIFGSAISTSLQKTHQWSKEKATDYMREHQSIVPTRY